MIGLQDVANGVMLGATIGLGAVGLTLTYSILGFANFAHGELITGGAYAALTLFWLLAATVGWGVGHFGALSFGAPFLVVLAAAMLLTAALAIGLAEALSVPLVGAEYRAAVAFVVLLAVLVIRPAGIAGGR